MHSFSDACGSFSFVLRTLSQREETGSPRPISNTSCAVLNGALEKRMKRCAAKYQDRTFVSSLMETSLCSKVLPGEHREHVVLLSNFPQRGRGPLACAVGSGYGQPIFSQLVPLAAEDRYIQKNGLVLNCSLPTVIFMCSRRRSSPVFQKEPNSLMLAAIPLGRSSSNSIQRQNPVNVGSDV